ncbi:reverse transcriptase [Trichonephila clavipes]|nr:reverse transcriptase [Trichonephila clavipes]
MPFLTSSNPALCKRSNKDILRISGSISTLTAHTCQKQTEQAWDGYVGCLRAHWPWEKKATNYDGEVLAVCEATTLLLVAGLGPAKVVFFIDSQAAILALSSNTPTDFLNTIQCRTKIVELISYGWTVALQYVPSYVGIPGNERADQKAKQGVKSSEPESA